MHRSLIAGGLVVILSFDYEDEGYVKWKTFCAARVTAEQLHAEEVYPAAEVQLRVYACTQYVEAKGVREYAE